MKGDSAPLAAPAPEASLAVLRLGGLLFDRAQDGRCPRVPPARVAVAVLVGAALFASSAAPAGAQTSAGARAASIAGVAVHPWRLGPDQTPIPFWPLRDPTQRERVFSAIQAMGIKTARVDLRWRAVEPLIKGVDDWGEFDGIHTSAQAHGITLLPVVAMPPDWANSGQGVWAYPDNPQDFEDFMVKAIERYPDIPAWEIWNEPNLPAFSEPNVDAAKFVDLLAAAHRAKERTGSSAAIVSGGLSSGGVDVVQYFEQMIRLHAFDYVNGFGIHPYSWVAPDQPEAFFLRLPYFHDRLVQIGRPDVGVWLTEYGAPTSTRTNEYGPPIGDAEQAARLQSAFAIASRWPWVRNLTWYEFEDLCDDPTNFMCNFGVVRDDMSPKPAATALKSIAAGNVQKIRSDISLTRNRSLLKLGRRALFTPLSLSGTLETPGAQGASYPVTLTLTWSPKFGGAARRSKTFRVNAANGRFATTITRMRPGYWRAVAKYAGSSDYESSTAGPVSMVVKRLGR
jgi:hypothetical protein